MSIYELDVIQATAGNPAVVRLSGLSVALIAAALTSMTHRFAWEDSQDDLIWDEIDAAVADVYAELWRNSMIGTVVFAAGAVPAGMLLCDGSSYLRAEYPDLYAALAPIYQTDADNFVVPNLVGYFVRGAAAPAGVGMTGGAATVTLTESQMPPHSHSYSPPTPNIDLESPGAPDIFAAGVGLPTNTGSAGGGQAHENLPPFQDLLPCILAS